MGDGERAGIDGEGASHLTAAQLEELRDELLRAQRRLERSRRTGEQALKPVTLDQTAVGRLSRVDAIQNQSIPFARLLVFPEALTCAECTA